MQVAHVAGKAPHFEAAALVNGEIKKLSLTDYADKWVVLLFYPKVSRASVLWVVVSSCAVRGELRWPGFHIRVSDGADCLQRSLQGVRGARRARHWCLHRHRGVPSCMDPVRCPPRAHCRLPRKEGGLGQFRIPLLADVTKSISTSYGVLLPAGIALRGTRVGVQPPKMPSTQHTLTNTHVQACS